MCDKKKERLEISKVTQIEKGFAHLPCTPPLFGFKMLILSGYTWVLEVLTASTQPCPGFSSHLFHHQTLRSLWRWCTRCLRSVAWISTARSKKGWDLESQLDGFCCWRSLFVGFGAVHCGVIDWLDGYEISKKEPPGMYKTGNLPTCQPQLVSWSRISEPQNSIERCHAFICWRGES